jgi:cytoskeletal protein RodZ
METIGSLFKDEREKQQKTLEEISNKTKISKSILNAIEEDRHDLLPSPSYVKGFLKLYARELDLDPEEVIKLYFKKIKEEKNKKSEKERKHSLLIKKTGYITTCIILFICLVSYCIYEYGLFDKVFTGRHFVPETTTTIYQPPKETSEKDVMPENRIEGGLQSTTSAPVSSLDDYKAGAIKQDEHFTVRFVARGITWIKITADDKKTFDIMLRAGETYVTTAEKSMKVRIGNAGGLSLFYNDIPLGSPGEEGKPVNLDFPEAAQGFKTNTNME